MMIAEIIGYIATILSLIVFLPQAMKSWKTKSTKDLSLGTYSMFTSSKLLWCIYGIMIVAWPIIIANAIVFLMSSIILSLKLKYK